jgi:hypothetical protein
MLSAKLVAPLVALALCASPASPQALQPITLAAISTGIDSFSSSSNPTSDYVVLNSPSDALTPHKKSKSKSHSDEFPVHPFSAVAVGIKAGTLGAGAEVATPLSRSLNLRAGANFAQFRYSFAIDGISYYTGVDYRSGQMSIDWFPFHGGFHISPGFLYFSNGASGAAAVSPAESFQLDNVNYINSIDDPVGGNASFVYHHHIAPALMFGFSNIIPRDGSQFSVPFEFGVAYTGAPQMAVQLSGTACTLQGCFNAGTDPGTQQNLKQEVKDVDNTVNKVVVYPIASLGLAFRF